MNEWTDGLLIASANIAIIMLVAALLLCLYRLGKGPTLLDRVVGFDLLTTITVTIIAVFSIMMNDRSVLDAALVLALIAFLGTVAFASYVERGVRDDGSDR